MKSLFLADYLAPMAVLLVNAIVLLYRSSARNAPALLMTALWLLLFFLHALVSGNNLVPLYPSGIMANSIIAGSVVTFSVAFALSRALAEGNLWTRGAKRDRNTIYSTPPSPLFARMLAIYAVLVLLLMYLTAIRITGASSLLSSLQNLRFQLNYDGAEWGVVRYLSLSVTVFSVYMVVATREERFSTRWPVFLAVLCSLTMAIISTQRTAIFMQVIALFFASSKGAFPKFKAFAILGSFLIIAFILVGFLVGKIGNFDIGFIDSLSGGLESFLLYLLTPLSALDTSKIWLHSIGDGAFSLRLFQLFGAKMGLFDGEIRDLVMEFVSVPVLTNVYTFAYVAVSDYGAFFFVYYIFVGSLFGVIFSIPRRSVAAATLQGFCYYSILLSVFQDQFVTILSQWIQIIFFILFARFITTTGRFRRVRTHSVNHSFISTQR